MKASELRIGNYIKVKGSILQVWALDLDLRDEGFELFSAGDYELVEFRNLLPKPVPLTKTIIQVFGAKPDDLEKDCFVISALTMDYKFQLTTLIDGDFYWTCNKVLGDNCFMYVHEFQNLVFALSGIELKMTEDEN